MKNLAARLASINSIVVLEHFAYRTDRVKATNPRTLRRRLRAIKAKRVELTSLAKPKAKRVRKTVAA